MKPRALVVTSSAQSDLDDILDYLTTAEPMRGPLYVDRMMSHFRARAGVGLTGTPTDHIAPNTRSFFFGSYVALLTTTESSLQIIRILHASRDIRALVPDADA